MRPKPAVTCVSDIGTPRPINANLIFLAGSWIAKQSPYKPLVWRTGFRGAPRQQGTMKRSAMAPLKPPPGGHKLQSPKSTVYHTQAAAIGCTDSSYGATPLRCIGALRSPLRAAHRAGFSQIAEGAMLCNCACLRNQSSRAPIVANTRPGSFCVLSVSI